jgi:hypothetical protein
MHTLPMARSVGDSFDSSSDHMWTRGAKPRQERRHEPSPQHPLARYRISDDRNVFDTIEARRHAHALSRTPEWRGEGVASYRFGPLGTWGGDPGGTLP